MSNAKENLNATKTRLIAISNAAPEVMRNFSQISKVASSNGSFSSAQKELIASAISVAIGCEDCILYHVNAAQRHGADENALIEVLEVAIEMGGGPAVMYASKALEAFRSLT